MKDLKSIRDEIDRIDERLVKLFNKRASLGVKIAEVKRAEGKPVFFPARENEILQKVARLNKGPLHDKAVQAIYREIFSATRSVEKDIKVACLGPEGTYSHLAARRSFGSLSSFVFGKSIDSVFDAVEKEQVDYGVVPIENSLEGPVGRTFDLLVNSPLKIYGEQYLSIHHNLLSRATGIDKIKTLYTHYMPLAQTREWVTGNLPKVRIVETSSSTEAAKSAVKSARSSASIGSAEAGAIYGLDMLAQRIEDQSCNQTRFFILSRKTSPKSGKDKTSVVFTLKDSAGALYEILQPFSKKKINLSKIQSRPIKTSDWEYAFFIDLDGHEEDDDVKWAFEKIASATRTVKILGSYPDTRA